MSGERTQEIAHLRRIVDACRLSVLRVVLPEHRHVVVGDMRLHYLDWGSRGRPQIVFLHGGGLSAHTWDVVCLALRNDYHCLALDQRGHGDSEWSPHLDYTLDAYLHDVEGFVSQLTTPPIAMVGQSLGAINALRYGCRFPSRLAGLVIIDAGPNVRQGAGMDRIVDFELGKGPVESIDEAVRRAMAFNPRRNPRLLRYSLLHSLRKLPDGRWTWKRDSRHLTRLGFAEFVTQLQAIGSEFESVRCPTLVVRGAESEVFSDEDAAKLASLVKEGQWVTVAHSGHNVQGDNPAGLLDVMRPFLAGLKLVPAPLTAWH